MHIQLFQLQLYRDNNMPTLPYVYRWLSVDLEIDERRKYILVYAIVQV